MSKPKLTEKQEKFYRFIVAGFTQTDSYRAAFNIQNWKPENITTEAHRLRKKLKIAMRIEELQAAARAEDVTNIGRELRKTLDMRDGALDANNFTAVASLQRLVLQAIGALHQHVILNVERSLGDDDLIQQLAGDDPAKIAAAKLLLGAGEGFPESIKETRH